jgi:protein ImuB
VSARTLTLWCPDWPLVGVDPDSHVPGAPVAVFVAEQVLACSATARAEGIRRGLRRREAQRRCPELTIADRDEAAEMRAFEPVLTALENVCPELEIVRPGLCLFGAKGPGRYFGGDAKLADAVAAAVFPALPQVPGLDGKSGDPLTPGARIGIADGPFAAGLAARHSPATDRPTIVSAGRTAEFLAPFPVTVLDRPDLADLFVRLGLRNLGELAALPARQMVSRFGPEGALIHRLARGADDPPRQLRPESVHFDVHEALDPPEQQIEPLAFVAKVLADRLQAELSRRGLGCTRLLVEAESEHGEARSRLWRQDGTLTATAIAQRVRWQLEGWLTGPADHRPSAGIALLRLTPSGVHYEDGEQLRLFGGPTDADERAAAAVTRLQGLLGFDAVYVAVPAGGRNPADGVRLLPWGENIPALVASPWPGQLPAPNPTVLYPEGLAAALLDGDGVTVSVTDRGVVSAVPQALSIHGGRALPITGWAGPWQVDERWWDPAAHLSCARFQVTGADGSARLLALRDAQWWVEGAYE